MKDALETRVDAEMRPSVRIIFSLVLLPWMAVLASAQNPRPAAFALVQDGTAVATVVVGAVGGPVERTALDRFIAGVERDSGLRLPVSNGLPESPGPVVVLGTIATNPLLASLAAAFALPVDQLPPEGFLLATRSDQHRQYLFVAGRDPRGVLYGVQEALDQVVTGTADGRAYVTECNLQCTTPLSTRGTYSLTCWGMAPRFDRRHWEKAIDSMSDAGMNRIMFWMDGLFRSRRYPYTFLDQTYFAGVQLTDQDIRDLIRYAHDRGMEFLFGSGVFGWFTSQTFSERFPDATDPTGTNLNPSNAAAQQLTRDYLLEMIEVFPEADGYMLEIRDEIGDCLCQTCQTPLDGFGSKQFGQSELDLLSSLSAAVWQRSPAANFVWLIGYGNHDTDRLYYDRIRTMGQDPRLEWMEVRGSWTLPAMDGSRRPLTYFSSRIAHWDGYYALSRPDLQSAMQRTVGAGLYGYLPAYEPGFNTASIYGDEFVPFPVDQIPYVLTQFYYRAFTWNPAITYTALVDRACQKFFTSEVPRQLAEDLFWLRDFNQAHYPLFTGVALLGVLRAPSLAGAVDQVWNNPGMSDKQYWLNRLADEIRVFQTLCSGGGDMMRISQIEARIAAARTGVSRRSQGSLDLMQRHIDDIRRLLRNDPDAAQIDFTLYHIDKLIAQYLGRPVPPAPFVTAFVEPGDPAAPPSDTERDGPVYGGNGAYVEPGREVGYSGRYNGSVAWMVSKFRLSNFLPPGTTATQIASAQLSIPRTDVLWTGDPFTSLDLVLHHFVTTDPNTITSADYHTQTPALTDYGIVIPRHTRMADSRAALLVDVTAAVRDDLKQGRPASSFRIGSNPAGALAGVDLTYFATADNTDPAFGPLDDYMFRNVMKLIIRTRDCGAGVDEDADGVSDACDDCPGTFAGTPVDVVGCPLPVPGDFDGDGDVDQEDFGHLQACLSIRFIQPISPGCLDADLNDDGNVDNGDLSAFLNCLTGADEPAACRR